MPTLPIRLSRRQKALAGVALAAGCLAPMVRPLRAAMDPAVTYEAMRELKAGVASPTLLLIGAALGLAWALWHGWLALAASAWVAGLAGRTPRAAKLAGAALMTAIALSMPAWFIAESVIHRDALIRPSVARALEREVTPAWPAIVRALEQGLPPGDLPLPEGDPTATLRRMVASPMVAVAFHVTPAGQLRMLARSATDPRVTAGPVDLLRWRPEATYRAKVAHIDPDRQARRSAEHTRELYIERVVDRLNRIWGHQRLQFHPIPGETMWEPTLIAKGLAKHGVLGYFPDEQAINAAVDAVLAPAGLAREAEVIFTERPIALLPLFAPPVALPPTLQGLHLMPTAGVHDPFNERENARRFLILLLATAVGGFGLALTYQQVRAFLDDRAVALAQSNFVSAVSHEMRTPLTTIKLYAEMVEQGVITEPDRRAQYMRTIARECDRLSRLIENVLDYAKISGRRRDYTFEPTALRPVVDEALLALQAPLEAAGLAVELDVPDDLTLRLDRDAVVQVVINLVGNAAKYAASGGRVTLVARAEGDRVTLAVRDFGPGIAPAEQARVFQAFYRVGDETTRTAAGTGLGLALARAHAEAHGGRLELESAPGAGATFRLVLPVERTAA